MKDNESNFNALNTRKKIYFIVNPFAGLTKNANFSKKIHQYLDLSLFDYQVVYTEYAGHATLLAKNAVVENFDIVVAVGGDGSVNEVAQSLIGTKVILGIIPAGSGNGLAMHLGLGRNISKALQMLNTSSVIKIDTCSMNGKPFINLAGVGFDAWIAYKTKQSKVRGLWAYLKFSFLEAFKYPIKNYQITIDGHTINRACLVIEIANAPMFGYNLVVAPLAKFNDGLLEVILIRKAAKWRYLFSFWRFFNQSVHKSSLTERYTAKNIRIKKQHDKLPTHIDGEGFLSDQDLEFSINELSLHILTPKNSKHQTS